MAISEGKAAVSNWQLAVSKTNPNPRPNTDSSASPRLCGEIGGQQ
jgi:hypothetical protein